MLKGRDIICFSSIDWDFIWQGHQEIMSALATNGNRVLFVENTGIRRPGFSDIPRLLKRLSNWRRGIGGIRQEGKNLYIYSPLALPFPYSRFVRWMNTWVMTRHLKKWMTSLQFHKPIAWVFLPTGIVLSIIKDISVNLVIYYCIDDFSKSSKYAKKIARTEKELLEKADLVFVTSQHLFEKCRRYNENVFSFPFGVNMDNFDLSKIESLDKPSDIAYLQTPLIGYIGGIHRWIDQQLIKEMARHFPDCSFIFVGPIHADIKELKDEKNIVFLGQRSREDLPRYVKYFKTCLIPYTITPYTENVYPTKLNEYLALGKSVISTALPEILNFNRENGNVVTVANNSREFSDGIDAVLKQPESEENGKRLFRREVAAKNTWEARIEQMSMLIQKTLEQKLEQQEIHWKENLIHLYKVTRKNTINAAMVLAGGYLLVFHTPLLWWLAAPLQHSDSVVRSDMIVVLGGGVGESGMAGEGYQERVKEGVDLYLSGFSDRLLFLSGYQYSLQEVEVMKALAVELGVARDRILLDKSLVNTYDYIVCIKETLEKNHAHSVIIVSSPYHMRRVFEVAQKVLAGYKVCLVPIRNSIFFGNHSVVRVRHIRAIMHEYLALLYYAFRGYI